MARFQSAAEKAFRRIVADPNASAADLAKAGAGLERIRAARQKKEAQAAAPEGFRRLRRPGERSRTDYPEIVDAIHFLEYGGMVPGQDARPEFLFVAKELLADNPAAQANYGKLPAGESLDPDLVEAARQQYRDWQAEVAPELRKRGLIV